VDLEIEQIRVVSSKFVSAIIPNMNPKVADDSANTQEEGVQSGNETDFPELVTGDRLRGE
jgi:hypothetical protein